MEPIDQYINLIHSAQNRITPDGYIENHHIFPRTFTGEDPDWKRSNDEHTVALTAQEHFEAHRLLAEIFPDYSDYMTTVFRFFAGMAKSIDGNITPDNYEIAKIRKAKQSSEKLLGRPAKYHPSYDDTQYIMVECKDPTNVYIGTQYELIQTLDLCQSHVSRHITFVIKGIAEKDHAGRKSVGGFKIIGKYDKNKHLSR